MLIPAYRGRSINRFIDLHMSLEQKDLELIERIVYKNADDIAVSIARSFERLEERVDDSESRIYSRLGEIEDKFETGKQDIVDTVSDTVNDAKETICRMGMRSEEGSYAMARSGAEPD